MTRPCTWHEPETSKWLQFATRMYAVGEQRIDSKVGDEQYINVAELHDAMRMRAGLALRMGAAANLGSVAHRGG